MVALGSAVFMLADRHRRAKMIASGFASIGMLILYGLPIAPHRLPLLSLANGCFLVSGLIALACLVYAVLTSRRSILLISTGPGMTGIATALSSDTVPHAADVAEGERQDQVRAREANAHTAHPWSWTEMIIPRLPRVALVLVATYVAVMAAFWIQWMRTSTLCQ